VAVCAAAFLCASLPLVAQHRERAGPPAAKGETDGKPAAAPAPAEAAAPQPQGPQAAVGEFQPVLHAQGAKITSCMDTIVGESATVIDAPHTAISSWTTTAPNDNVFVSIVGLNYANNKAVPNGAAILFAAQVGGGKCEGSTVQIYPFAQSCGALQASLIKEGRTIATLRALPVVETKNGYRDVLIPTTGGGCVLVSVGMRQWVLRPRCGRCDGPRRPGRTPRTVLKACWPVGNEAGYAQDLSKAPGAIRERRVTYKRIQASCFVFVRKFGLVDEEPKIPKGPSFPGPLNGRSERI